MRLKDRVAIVTGGGGGIGRAIADLIAREGGKVVVIDIDLRAAEETLGMIRDRGGQAHAVKTDVTQKTEVRRMVEETRATYGRIDILVNNAGGDTKGSIVDFPEETWDMLIDVNLKGVFLCTQAVVPTMIEHHYGRIVNMSSMAGKTGEALTSLYCAAKFGVIGFTQAVAQEVGKYNITVNAVCPGPVNTELIRKSIAQSAAIRGMDPQQFMQEFYVGLTPLGRIAEPADVAQAVVFLASDEAQFITGSSLNVSGGREMH